jgi:hypothetical protein
MAQVKMVGHISGFRDGVEWPAAGELLTVDQLEAEHLIGAGLAVPAKSSTVEVAMAEPVVETATAAPRKRRTV